MLPGRCCLSDKLNVLFEPRHARWIHSHFLFKNCLFAACHVTLTHDEPAPDCTTLASNMLNSELERA